VFANVVQRKVFGHRVNCQKAGDSCIESSRIICAPRLMLLRTNESWRVKCRDVRYTWEK
jgi:hypothetical protein